MELSSLSSHPRWNSPVVMYPNSYFAKESIIMASSLSPFTRITLLISELKGNKVEDLADVKRCDLAHHTAKLHEGFESAEQKETAHQIGEQSRLLLSWIREGEFVKAEEERQILLSSCKRLKDLL
jgi:hypothetical protein